jgi:hypothetical protein
MVVPMAHPVEVYSDTTRGPAHSEEIVRPHASMRSPPFPQPGHGCENESEEREKAHRRPSPTSVVSHEMSSSFVDVPGALATARFANPPPPPQGQNESHLTCAIVTLVSHVCIRVRHGGNEDCTRGCERPGCGRVRPLHVL